MPNEKQYTIEFMADSGRYFTVVGSDAVLQDLCMGPHARQRQQQEANRVAIDMGFAPRPIDPPRAHGEIKGCRLRFGRVKPPFSVREQVA